MSTRPGGPTAETTLNVGVWDVVVFLWRGARFALFVGVLAGATAFLVSRQTTPVYRATAALLASQRGAGYSDLGLTTPPQVDPGVYQTALMEGPVARRALTTLHGTPPTDAQLERFLRSVHVSVQRQDLSSIIRVTVDARDPNTAATTANALADGLVAWDRDRARQGLASSIAALESSVADLDSQLAAGDLTAARRQALTAFRDQRARELASARSRGEAAVVVGLLEPLSTATPPDAPASPRTLLKTAIATLMGLAVAYLLLFLRTAIDPNVRSREELGRLTGLPVLAEFPRNSRRNGRLTGESAGFLIAGLARTVDGRHPLVVAVTSPHAWREKEGVALALARSLARGEGKVLLVDADLRQPSIARGLDVSTVRTPPLEVYLETPERRYAPQPVPVGDRRSFDFVPSFTSARHPVELLQRGFARVLRAWQEAYDVVVIDSPPLLPFADTLAIAPWCTGVVLCAGQGESRRDEVLESLARLRQQDVEVLGATLTRVPVSRRTSPTGYPWPAEQDVPDVEPADPYLTLGKRRGMQRASVKER